MIKYFERTGFKFADKVVAVSKYTGQVMRDVLKNVNPMVISNGVDTDFFYPESDNLDVDKRKVRLLFVGNMSRRKGFDFLPEIMKRLGDGYELFYTSGLRTTKGLQKFPNMIPLGKLNQFEIREEYRKADILVFPTRMEGLPLSAMEAMACGTPVVTFNTSSLPEIVRDGVCGKLCPIDNPVAFTEAVKELSSTPQLLKTMGLNAKKIIEKNFSFNRMVDQYILLFKSMRNA